MIRPIYLYGSGVLREKALPADTGKKDEIKQLVTDLWDTLAESEGCGLAAPQIGESVRVVVVDGDVMSDMVSTAFGSPWCSRKAKRPVPTTRAV